MKIESVKVSNSLREQCIKNLVVCTLGTQSIVVLTWDGSDK